MIGSMELVVIFFVILLLFGGKKLPELAKSLGVGIREFKKATQGEEEDNITTKQAEQESNNEQP